MLKVGLLSEIGRKGTNLMLSTALIERCVKKSNASVIPLKTVGNRAVCFLLVLLLVSNICKS